MKLTDRVDKLDEMFRQHIEESGAIRTDLAWLKKAFWTLAGAVVVAAAAQLIKPGVSNGATYLSAMQSFCQRH